MKPEDWIIPASELEERLRECKDMGYSVEIRLNGEFYEVDWTK